MIPEDFDCPRCEIVDRFLCEWLAAGTDLRIIPKIARNRMAREAL